MKPDTLRRTAILTAILVACPAFAAADKFVIDERHTFPSFEISHIGFSTQRGRFDKTSGTITLDIKNKTGQINISMDANSIDTGLAELEDRLKKEDFFNTAKYPTIIYTADKLVFDGETPTRADGNLTLLGTTKPVSLDIQHFRCGVHPINKKAVCGADAAGVIKRSDFGITAFLPAVGDEVKILIQVEGFKE
ncbi:YceI family protein [Methylomagnum sp.]